MSRNHQLPLGELRDYLVTRFARGRILALGALLLFASRAARGSVHLEFLLTDTALVCGLLLQFRLWDDLWDLPRDRTRHPDRVLSRTARENLFWSFLGCSALINVTLSAWIGSARAVICLVGLTFGLGAWYAVRGRMFANAANVDRMLNYHVVLLKYPVFVALLARGDGVFLSLAACAAAVYLVLCVHEVLHDEELRLSPAARFWATAEFTLLATLLLACFVASRAFANSAPDLDRPAQEAAIPMHLRGGIR